MTPGDVPDGPVLVDTDVFSWMAWRRGRYQEFEALLEGHELAISFATVGELRAGAIRGDFGERRRRELEQLVRRYAVIPSTNAVTERWAALYAQLKDHLKAGGVNDMWIAACALAQAPALPVATGNVSDFLKISEVMQLTVVHPDR